MDGNLETRDILNCENEVIGTLSLPENTSEDVWTQKLAPYATQPSVRTLQTAVAEQVTAAMEFGRKLMAEVGAENVLLGYSVEDIKQIMTKTERVQMALLAGALHIAIDELASIVTDEVLVTAARITSVRNKIQTYLGLPLT